MPYSDEYRTVAPRGTHGKKKKKHLNTKRLMKNLRRAFRRGFRSLTRGAYRAYVSFRRLPKRARLLCGGVGASVLVILIIAVAAANAKRAQERELEAVRSSFTLSSAFSAQEPVTEVDPPVGSEPYGETASVEIVPVQEELPENVSAAAPVGTEPSMGVAELKEGDDGAIVSTIQARLMELGYMDSDEPTEHFGPITESAVKKFQRHNGLDDDGICGETTYSMLMSDEAKIYVMQVGDSGEDVKYVQTRLYELGYLDNKANITSTFGEKTELAAKEFQKKNTLTADGKVGVKTINMLYDEDVVGKSYKLGDENPIIKQCQTELKELGFITFKPDGVMGKTTVSGIKAFQRANGLTVDGCLGPETRDLILSGKAQAMVLQLGDSGTDVKNMQSYLVKLRYLKKANATGYFGEITKDAVKYFQKKNSLTQDGRVGAVTLSIMKSTNAKKAPTSYLSSQSKETTSGKSSSTSGNGSSSSGSSGSSSSTNTSGVERMISVAESKLGCKYVTGAKGPNTFDCSGFVYYCMRQAGISCSYQTSIMWRSCSKYSRITSMGSLKRGDILVFSGSTASTGHVGIYLGNGKMIDASSSAGVVRQSSTVLKSGGYWTQHFLMAYRVF